MDGSNVNWKFTETFSNEFDDNFDASFLKMGSCRVRVAHGGFQAGHKTAQ